MSETVETPVAEMPTVTELHTAALEALHTAHDAVQAYLDHTDVADDTVLHVTARHTVGLVDQALLAMHGAAQAVAATDPPPVEATEPEPAPMATEAGQRWHPQPEAKPEA